jgi:hypothetical protein
VICDIRTSSEVVVIATTLLLLLLLLLRLMTIMTIHSYNEREGSDAPAAGALVRIRARVTVCAGKRN